VAHINYLAPFRVAYIQPGLQSQW